MAAQPTEEVIEWHKRLNGDSFDYWIPTSVTACFTEEKLKALSDIHSSGNFSNLSECLKTKLLLALCNMPQRNSDQWRQHIDAIFNVALSEGSESWVRPIADMLYTLPSLGYLRTGLEDNPLVSDALTTVQTKRPWRLSSLPMEAEFVNPDVLVDLGCPDAQQQQQQQQQQRHFVIVRKPRSVVAMGVILEKAAKQRDDGQDGGGRRYTAPIKMRSFAKNWYDEDDNDRPANESSSASGRRPQASSLASSAHRLPVSQMRQRSSQPPPPLHMLARQRSINPPSTPGGPVGLHHHQSHPQSQQQQQQQQQRTTKLIELSEPPAIGRAAKARRRQEEAERRRQEERAAKEEAAARAAQAREVEEARKLALAKETEEAAAAAEAAAASAAAAAAAAASVAAAATAAAPAPPASSAINVSRGNVQANVSMATPTAYNAGTTVGGPLPHLLPPMAASTQSPSVVPATLPSLRLTPANSQQQQQQTPAPAPTPSYLLPFASSYAGQMQQPTLFAYSQPTASATPNNITVVQLVNRPYPVQQQLQNQQQPLQHQHQLQHQPLTPEQTRAAAELFATANKLTKPEKSLIVAFIGGNRTNLTPELGHLVRIHLSEYKERVFDQNQRVYKDVVADQYFQMDYSTGDWTIVKRYKEGAPEVLARLEYLRPQQQLLLCLAAALNTVNANRDLSQEEPASRFEPDDEERADDQELAAAASNDDDWTPTRGRVTLRLLELLRAKEAPGGRVKRCRIGRAACMLG